MSKSELDKLKLHYEHLEADPIIGLKRSVKKSVKKVAEKLKKLKRK